MSNQIPNHAPLLLQLKQLITGRFRPGESPADMIARDKPRPALS